MVAISLYEVTWKRADMDELRPGSIMDQAPIADEYSALVIRGPGETLRSRPTLWPDEWAEQNPFLVKLNEPLRGRVFDTFEEVWHDNDVLPELLVYMDHDGQGSDVLPAVRRVFKHELKLGARKTAKPLTQRELMMIGRFLGVIQAPYTISSEEQIRDMVANPRNRFLRVRSATTYLPPEQLLKASPTALALARAHLKYKPGGQGFEEARASFRKHARLQKLASKKSASKKKRKGSSTCVGRPRSNCASDPCKWAGPGPKGRQFCRIAKNRKRSRS